MGATLTVGKVRGLQQIASPEGIFLMCAMDHRDSLQTMIDEKHPKEVSYLTMVQRKEELCAALAPYSSAILLDPIYGAAQCITSSLLPRHAALLVSIEATGYEGGKERRLTTLLPGWGVEKIKRMGASAVKLLLYYRPDMEDVAAQQRETARKVAEDCLKYDIPFLLEHRSYPQEGESPEQFARLQPQVVMDTARQLTALPIEVLKAEFPTDLRYEKKEKKLLELCHQLNEASQVPWVILSAGVDYETFRHQVEIACRGGASGFLGGRAIWQEAMRIADTAERRKYLSTIAAGRLKELGEIASRYAVPWHKKLKPPMSGENWYKTY